LRLLSDAAVIDEPLEPDADKTKISVNGMLWHIQWKPYRSTYGLSCPGATTPGTALEATLALVLRSMGHNTSWRAQELLLGTSSLSSNVVFSRRDIYSTYTRARGLDLKGVCEHISTIRLLDWLEEKKEWEDEANALTAQSLAGNSCLRGPIGGSVSQKRKQMTQDYDHRAIKHRRPRRHEDYTIAWICYRYYDLAAAIAMLDEEHEELPTRDANHYVFGRVGNVNVILSGSFEGAESPEEGIDVTLQGVRGSFSGIKHWVFTCVRAGFPSPVGKRVRYGDVIVSTEFISYVETVESGRTRLHRVRTMPSSYHARAPPVKTDSRASQDIVDVVSSRLVGSYAQPLCSIHMSPSTDAHETGPVEQSKVPSRTVWPSRMPLVHFGAVACGSDVTGLGATDLDVIGFDGRAEFTYVQPTLVVQGVPDNCASWKRDDCDKHAAANASAFVRLHLLGLDGRYSKRRKSCT
jgi:hypothetical protein